MNDHIKNHGQTNQKPKLCAVETVNGIKFDGPFLCEMDSQQRQKQTTVRRHKLIVTTMVFFNFEL